MIEISGKSGGGQILRTALGLGVLTGKAFRMKEIRASRPKPGLAAQHLECVKVLAEISNAHVEGAELGSKTIEFIPRKKDFAKVTVDIKTAGSTTLVLQSLLLASNDNKTIKISMVGGTDVKWSPPIDFMKHLILPHLRGFYDSDISLKQRGYFPKGGGQIEVKLKPVKAQGQFNETMQGELQIIRGISHASSELSGAQVAERQALGAKSVLNIMDCDINIQTEYSNSTCLGSGITLWALFKVPGKDTPVLIGADALGERGKNAEVGADAARLLTQRIKTCAAVDEHVADNLIPFMAIAGGKIKTSRITNHIKTSIDTTKLFLDCDFKIDGPEIECTLSSPLEALRSRPSTSNCR